MMFDPTSYGIGMVQVDFDSVYDPNGMTIVKSSDPGDQFYHGEFYCGAQRKDGTCYCYVRFYTDEKDVDNPRVPNIRDIQALSQWVMDNYKVERGTLTAFAQVMYPDRSHDGNINAVYGVLKYIYVCCNVSGPDQDFCDGVMLDHEDVARITDSLTLNEYNDASHLMLLTKYKYVDEFDKFSFTLDRRYW